MLSGTSPLVVLVGLFTQQREMPVWWSARLFSMRVWCVTTVLAALALRSAAEPSRRYSTEWRNGREITRSRPLQELFDPEPESAYVSHQPPPLPAGALHKERRRIRNNKRASHQIPTEMASQMMLRASRSNRPYDVPQIGQSDYISCNVYFIITCYFIRCLDIRLLKYYLWNLKKMKTQFYQVRNNKCIILFSQYK